ncbi:MAG: hypothetical protein R3E95_07900 [Thiolinea sp.]
MQLHIRIQAHRQDALLALQQALAGFSLLLSSLAEPELSLHSGFPGTRDERDPDKLSRFLSERQGQEIQQGNSLYGAHREICISACRDILRPGLPRADN